MVVGDLQGGVDGDAVGALRLAGAADLAHLLVDDADRVHQPGLFGGWNLQLEHAIQDLDFDLFHDPSILVGLGQRQACQSGFDPGARLGQALLHVGLGHGSLAQTAAQQLVLVGELAGDFKQAPDAL